jgi:glucokinase
MSGRTVIGIDIGGTKTAAALVSDAGTILQRLEVPTCQKGYPSGFEQICTLINQEKAIDPVLPISGIGIGIPAALERKTDRILWAPNIQGWREVDLRKDLEKEFNLPVKIEYDGHTAVLGEWWIGKGRGLESIVDVVIGTGIGSGAIIDGSLIRGHDRLAGAIGWQALTTVSRSSSGASSLGYWENLAAGPGIARYANRILTKEEKRFISPQSGKVDSKMLFTAARNGYAPAVKAASRIAEWLGIGISNIVSMLNPEMIILGGSVGSACEFLLPEIQHAANLYAQPISAASVKLVLSELGTDAGLAGAAFAIIRSFDNK